MNKLKEIVTVAKVKAKRKAHLGEHWGNIGIALMLFLGGHGIEAALGGVAATFGLIAILTEIGEDIA